MSTVPPGPRDGKVNFTSANNKELYYSLVFLLIYIGNNTNKQKLLLVNKMHIRNATKVHALF